MLLYVCTQNTQRAAQHSKTTATNQKGYPRTLKYEHSKVFLFGGTILSLLVVLTPRHERLVRLDDCTNYDMYFHVVGPGSLLSVAEPRTIICWQQQSSAASETLLLFHKIYIYIYIYIWPIYTVADGIYYPGTLVCCFVVLVDVCVFDSSMYVDSSSCGYIFEVFEGIFNFCVFFCQGSRAFLL